MHADNRSIGDEETDFDYFGKSVSSQLKKLSEEQATIAQEKIQSILTQCKLADIRAKRSTSAFSCSNPQFTQSVQHVSNAQSSQLNPIQYYPSTETSQTNYSAFSPPPVCLLPEASPAGTSSSSLGFNDENREFASSPYNNDSVDESTQGSNIIQLAFKHL